METRQLTTYHSRPNNADSLKGSIWLNINRSPQLLVAFTKNSTLSRRQRTTKHCVKTLTVKVKMKTNLNLKEHVTPVCCDPNRLTNVFLIPVLPCKEAVCSVMTHWYTILLCAPDAKHCTQHPLWPSIPLFAISQHFLCVSLSLTKTEAADG